MLKSKQISTTKQYKTQWRSDRHLQWPPPLCISASLGIRQSRPPGHWGWWHRIIRVLICRRMRCPSLSEHGRRCGPRRARCCGAQGRSTVVHGGQCRGGGRADVGLLDRKSDPAPGGGGLLWALGRDLGRPVPRIDLGSYTICVFANNGGAHRAGRPQRRLPWRSWRRPD